MAATFTKTPMPATAQVVVKIIDDDGIEQVHTLALFEPDGTDRDVEAEITALVTAADEMVSKRRAAFGRLNL
jgi:hypothetical protein